MPSWLQTDIRHYSAHLGLITWLNNGSRQGQANSIDRAYSLVATDYVFHLEDDWHYFSPIWFGREHEKGSRPAFKRKLREVDFGAL